MTRRNRATRQSSGGLAATSPGRRPFPAVAYLVAVAAIVLALAACTDDTSDGTPAGSPTVSAPQQDARGTAEERALAAYQGMWRAYAKAGAAANADEPDLGTYASGEALKTLKDGLAALKREGNVFKGDYGSNPRVARASPAGSPSSIDVEDCLDDSKFLEYKASGGLANDTPGGRRATRATVSLVTDATWKVTGFAVQAVGTC